MDMTPPMTPVFRGAALELCTISVEVGSLAWFVACNIGPQMFRLETDTHVSMILP